MTTKSEIMRIVAQGRHHETYCHSTLGHFNVTLTRILLRGQTHWLRHVNIEPAHITWLETETEIDLDRCNELTAAQLNDPAIFIEVGDGTQCLIDGTHRIYQRHRIGLKDFDCHIVPIRMVPKVDPRTFQLRPWGKKEIVGGKLVTMKDGMVPDGT